MNKREKETSSREKKVKRVKTHHARPNILSLTPVNIDCFHEEEKEPIEDCQLKFKEACNEIREYFQEILLAKLGRKNEVDIEERKHSVSNLIAKLKKLNRLDKHQWKKSRDAVNERKLKVDALNLQYQNLLYEVTHLQKEVTKCLEFRSKDEEIELVPIEEFYREAPEDISKPELTKNDPHELTVARLMWELEQRKRFANKLKEAEVTKEEYIQKIRKLKERLSNILPTLQSVIEAAEPIQTKLGMPFQAMHLKHKSAKFLPIPLYILYVQACAYKEEGDKKMQISIEGSIDEVKVFQIKTEELSDESGESDQEDSTEMNMHRRSDSSKKEDGNKDILKKHPMSVRITIECKESKMVLEFTYLFRLHIVTVSVKSLSIQPVSSDLIGDLLKLDTFLSCLFPADNGKQSPNLANVYSLNRCGYEESPFTNDTTGYPYKWAQQIAGLEYLSASNDEANRLKASFKNFSSYMERTIHAIRYRLIARSQLSQQIFSLGQKISVPPKFAALYPANISSQMKKWTPVEWKEISNYSYYAELVELNIVSEDSLIFNTEIMRGSAILSALVVIAPDYPLKPPIFLLQLQWKGSRIASSFALKELEEEVNVHFVESLAEEFQPYLLICQMHHLSVCFDVFLETECSGNSCEGPHEFQRDKVVTRSARGPSHSRPYKCISNQGIFTFR